MLSTLEARKRKSKIGKPETLALVPGYEAEGGDREPDR